eukprot:GHVU01115566.1.p1 GENE.GHVU01115566.1~~GHVU01115566.1.p1  ORF type:complete len:150 (-),score=2.18 GHVU01115566.1:341-790(-)
MNYIIIYYLNRLLKRSLIHQLCPRTPNMVSMSIHMRVHSFTHSLIHPCMHSFIHASIDAFIYSHTDCRSSSFIRSFVCSFVRSLVCSFARSLGDSFFGWSSTNLAACLPAHPLTHPVSHSLIPLPPPSLTHRQTDGQTPPSSSSVCVTD